MTFNDIRELVYLLLLLAGVVCTIRAIGRSPSIIVRITGLSTSEGRLEVEAPTVEEIHELIDLVLKPKGRAT